MVLSCQAIQNTSSFVLLQLRSIFQAALFRARVCSVYHGVGLFSSIFLKRKGATVYKVLEKRESIVSVTSSSFSALVYLIIKSFVFAGSRFPPPSSRSKNCVTLVPKPGRKEGDAVREPSLLREIAVLRRSGSRK